MSESTSKTRSKRAGARGNSGRRAVKRGEPTRPLQLDDPSRDEQAWRWWAGSFGVHVIVVLLIALLVWFTPIQKLLDQTKAAEPEELTSAEKIEELDEMIEELKKQDLIERVEELEQIKHEMEKIEQAELQQYRTLEEEMASTAIEDALKAQEDAIKAQELVTAAQKEAMDASPDSFEAQDKALQAQAMVTEAQTRARRALSLTGTEMDDARKAQAEAEKAQQKADAAQDEAKAAKQQAQWAQRASDRANQELARAEDRKNGADKRLEEVKARHEAAKKNLEQQKANVEAAKQAVKADKPRAARDLKRAESAKDKAEKNLASREADLKKAENAKQSAEKNLAEAKAEAEAKASDAAKKAEAAPAKQAEAKAAQEAAKQAQKDAASKTKAAAAKAAQQAAEAMAQAKESAKDADASAESLQSKSAAEIYKKAVETEGKIVKSFQNVRAAELAKARQIPLAEAKKSTDVETPKRPEVKTTDSPKTAAELDANKEALKTAVREADSMVGLASSMLMRAHAQMAANEQGMDVTGAQAMAAINNQAATAQAFEMAAQADKNMGPKDLTKLMKGQVDIEKLGGGNGDENLLNEEFWRKLQPSLQPQSYPVGIDMDNAKPGRRFITDGDGAETVFIDSWYIIGPFPNPHRKYIDRRYPPESVIDLNAVYEGKDGEPVRWRFKQSGNPRINPAPEGDGRKGHEEYVIYYAYTEVFFDQPRDLWLAVGSDDFAKVWINGHLVFISNRELKNWQYWKGNEQRRVHFKQGVNRILYRIENGHGGCYFSLGIALNARMKAAK